MTPVPIYFYRERDKPYGCFSNFSRHSFQLDGQSWQTVEHYFQAMKFVGTPRAYEIQLAKAPMEAKIMGNDRNYPIRQDWEQVKDGLMRRAVFAKFEIYHDIRAILLGTDEAELIENAPDDYYWGCGERKTGKNMLGKVLMETREKLR